MLFRIKMNSRLSAEMSTGQDWIELDQTEANFVGNGTGSDYNFFENGWIRTGLNWQIFIILIVIILNISKILVVIRFYRFAKWL